MRDYGRDGRDGRPPWTAAERRRQNEAYGRQRARRIRRGIRRAERERATGGCALSLGAAIRARLAPRPRVTAGG